MNAIVGLLALMIPGADDKDKPSSERRAVGRLVSADVVLLRGDGDGWARVAKDEVVHTAETLISLAGYKSEIKLDSKVGLVLRGELPEARRLPLLESSATLHRAADRDVDLTLHRGRIYLSNDKAKGAAEVRLRFRDHVWDLTLDEPGAMAGFEVMPVILAGEQTREEEPVVHVTLYVLKGRATLKSDVRTFGDLAGPTGRSLLTWDNKEGKLRGPHSVEKAIPEWNVDPAPSITLQPYMAALEGFARQFDRPGAKVNAVLLDNAKGDDPRRRLLATRALAAVNAVGALLDLLVDEGKERPDVRRAAILALRQTLSRGPEQANLLYDRKKKTGLLIDRGYKPTEAETVVDLLYPLPSDLRKRRETFELLVQLLKHDKLALRELAYHHLTLLAPGQKAEYDPAGSAEDRARGHAAWKKLLDDGKLPPVPEKP